MLFCDSSNKNLTWLNLNINLRYQSPKRREDIKREGAKILKEENMAVKIRLTRMGDKKAPFYRVIVADSRAPRDGKFIDIIGTYNPLKDPAEIKIDTQKAEKWLKNGATPTDTARDILVKSGVIEKKNK